VDVGFLVSSKELPALTAFMDWESSDVHFPNAQADKNHPYGSWFENLHKHLKWIDHSAFESSTATSNAGKSPTIRPLVNVVRKQLEGKSMSINHSSNVLLGCLELGGFRCSMKQIYARLEMDTTSFVWRRAAVTSQTATTTQKPAELFQKSEILVCSPQSLSHPDRVYALKAGIDLELNYLGRVDDFAVYNANCPADLNCALHITGISPGASNEEIIEQIHEGGILSFHRKNPIHGFFSTCAATVVFQERFCS